MKKIMVVVLLLLASFIGGVAATHTGRNIIDVFVTNFPQNQQVTVANFPQPQAPALHTTSVDLEILPSRETGIFVAPPTANFTAGFSFAPHRGFVQVTTILFTIEWNQFSLGHVGDRFSVQLNGHPATLTAPLVAQTSQVTVLPSQDLRVGSNILNISVIPIDPSQTTNYLLYEVRLTVEYTFLS